MASNSLTTKQLTVEQESSLQQLKQQLKSKESKININYDDQLLTKFLKSCDFNVQRTLTLFYEYSNARKNLSHIFVTFDDLYRRFELPLFINCPRTADNQQQMAFIPLK